MVFEGRQGILPWRFLFLSLKKQYYMVDKQYYTSYNIVIKIRLGGVQMAFQIGAALLDACVLAVLDRRDVYGYELTVNIKNVIEVSESTLYPVLRRLQKEAYLITYDQPYNGRNRRYYSITEKGRNKLLEYKYDWQEYKANIDKIMTGDF